MPTWQFLTITEICVVVQIMSWILGPEGLLRTVAENIPVKKTITDTLTERLPDNKNIFWERGSYFALFYQQIKWSSARVKLNRLLGKC